MAARPSGADPANKRFCRSNHQALTSYSLKSSASFLWKTIGVATERLTSQTTSEIGNGSNAQRALLRGAPAVVVALSPCFLKRIFLVRGGNCGDIMTILPRNTHFLAAEKCFTQGSGTSSRTVKVKINYINYALRQRAGRCLSGYI